MERVTIYTDGSCMPNPGKAGYAAILIHDKTRARKEVTGFEPYATNNVAELLAVKIGIEALTQPCIVRVISDSQYVVNILNSVNKVNANAEWWAQVFSAIRQGAHEVKAEWVRGHADDRNNKAVHWLALRAQQMGKLEEA